MDLSKRSILNTMQDVKEPLAIKSRVQYYRTGRHLRCDEVDENLNFNSWRTTLGDPLSSLGHDVSSVTAHARRCEPGMLEVGHSSNPRRHPRAHSFALEQTYPPTNTKVISDVDLCTISFNPEGLVQSYTQGLMVEAIPEVVDPVSPPPSARSLALHRQDTV